MKKVTYRGSSLMSLAMPDDMKDRSCEGSLFFLPKQQKLISDEEYEYICDSHKEEAKLLRCQRMPLDEKIVLGKRKGLANSVNLRDAKDAKQYDGNKMHVEKAKKEAAKKPSVKKVQPQQAKKEEKKVKLKL